MIVDTNTVEKTILLPDSSVRVLLFWRNVDGRSVERVTVYGTSGGMDEPLVAGWERSDGRVKTRFSAPARYSSEFVSRLLVLARDIGMPAESEPLYRTALDDMESKCARIASDGQGQAKEAVAKEAADVERGRYVPPLSPPTNGRRSPRGAP